MKKTAILVCALVCVAMTAGTLFFTAHADAHRSEKFPEASITLNFTREFENTKCVIVPYGGTEIGGGIEIYETDLVYFALSQEEYDSNSENLFFDSNYASLVTIVSADNGMTFEDINKYSGGVLDPASFRPICTVEDCTHYLYDDPDAVLPEGTDAVYQDEFGKLKNSVDALLANSEFGKPENPADSIVGSRIAFETTDTEGNPVKSDELFGAHEITMINIWTIWCGYCIDEMEELEAINGRLAEKDCAVVGLLYDGDEEEALASGKETLKDKGVTYTNILPPGNVDEIFTISGYPTTYFVNREGIVIGKPITGAHVDQYEPMVEALLAEDEAAIEKLQSDSADEPDSTNNSSTEDSSTEDSAAAAEEEDPPLLAHVETNEDSLYRVIIKDENGNPVPDVVVEFCSDAGNLTGKTDETGTAVFQEKKGHYTVYIVEAPEKYEMNEAEFTLEEFCDLTIFLYEA